MTPSKLGRFVALALVPLTGCGASAAHESRPKTPMTAASAATAPAAVTKPSSVDAPVRDISLWLPYWGISAAYDSAVNNAGVVHSARALEHSEEDWRRVLSTNLDAVFYWAQEAARRMLTAGTGGSIVNIASVLGFSPDKGVIAYAAAKAGVIQLTKALAIELAFKGIRVNAIAPGWITTEINRDYLASERGSAMKRQIAMGRFGEVEDLDGPLLLLASDAGRYMTGSTIVADGGQLAALHV